MAQPGEIYRLRPDDQMIVSLYGEPTFDQRLTVAEDGTINVLLVGAINVQGMTADEVRREIERRLKEMKLYTDPKVVINLQTFRRPRVFVLGMVNRPGAFDFRYGDKVMDALSLGGSYIADRADLEKARLVRRDGSEFPVDLVKLLEEGDLGLNYELEDQDALVVPEQVDNRVFVGGQVLRPGQYPYRRRMTLLDALTHAGWNTERGRLSSVFVARNNEDGTAEKIPVDVIKLLNKADMDQNIALQPGDVVYVPETKTPDVRKVYDVVSLYWLARNAGILRSLWKP